MTPFYVVVLPNSSCLNMADGTSKSGKKNRKRGKNEDKKQSAGIEADNDPATDPGVGDIKVDCDSNACVTQKSPSSGDALHIDELDPQPSVDVPAQAISDAILNSVTAVDTPVSQPTGAEVNEINPNPDSSDSVVPEVQVGDVVYFVKNDAELTIPVFYSQLVQVKGSDASWVGDTEPPPEELDFSDDEEERLYKRTLRMKRRIPNGTEAGVSSDFDVPRTDHGDRPTIRRYPSHNATLNRTNNSSESSYCTRSPCSFSQPPQRTCVPVGERSFVSASIQSSNLQPCYTAAAASLRQPMWPPSSSMLSTSGPVYPCPSIPPPGYFPAPSTSSPFSFSGSSPNTVNYNSGGSHWPRAVSQPQMVSNAAGWLFSPNQITYASTQITPVSQQIVVANSADLSSGFRPSPLVGGLNYSYLGGFQPQIQSARSQSEIQFTPSAPCTETQPPYPFYGPRPT
ncbi:unnamed protein product [Calicophoron daubneyi]